MDTQEYILYTTKRNIHHLFEAARNLPADKLAWKPEPGARSALDQLQEVATALDEFIPGMKARAIDFDKDAFAAWVQKRAQITSLEQLEEMITASVDTLKAYLDELSPEDLDQTVQMPFPGSWNVADMVNFHTWNIAYHTGQINYIASLITTENPA